MAYKLDGLWSVWGHLKAKHIRLILKLLSGFYVDCQPPDYCFVPCGHMASERTVRYWTEVPLPWGTSGFQAACPFCAVPLTAGTPGFIKLIFDNIN